MAIGRATVCVAVSAASDGASAPTAARIGAATAAPTRIRRRPTRSASARRRTVKTMPRRTTVPATPCAVSLAPKSSAAKATVWLKSVLQSRSSAVPPRAARARGPARVEPFRRRPPRLRPPCRR